MGYTTDFEGQLTLSQPLTLTQFEYLKKFKDTRRMKRDVSILMDLYHGKYGYPGTSADKNTPEEIYGNEGEFFVGGSGSFGQDRDKSIIDYNVAPGGIPYSSDMDWNVRVEKEKELDEKFLRQPGLWCQWEVLGDENEMYLQWDGGEKFYSYIEWLKYLINKFFQPWGIMLNGQINWYGEDRSDMGRITVNDNVVKVSEAVVTYNDDDE